MTALLELGAGIGWVDAEAADAAREAVSPRTGRLGELITWLSAIQGHFPPQPPNRVRCIVLGPVSDALSELGEQHAVGIRETSPGDDPRAALTSGLAAVDDEIESGTDLLVLTGADSSDAPTTLIGLLSDAEPVAMLPRGVDAMDSAAWIARAAHLRDERRRVAPMRTRPEDLLAALGSAAVSAAAGVALQAAARRTPLVLDGLPALAAALLGHDIQSRAVQWWQVAATSPDRAHRRAVERLGQDPVLALGCDLADGTVGVLAVAVLRAALASGVRRG